MPDKKTPKNGGLGPSHLPEGWTPPGSQKVLDPHDIPRPIVSDRVREEIEQRRKEREAAEAEAEAERARLQAEEEHRLYMERVRNAPLYVNVNLVNLTGNGSDVDEIYGTLSVDVVGFDRRLGDVLSPKQEYPNSAFNLLDISGAIDVSDGKVHPTGGRRLPGCTIRVSPPIGAFATLSVTSRLIDEDDGRDGGRGNDEMFYFSRSNNNVMNFTTKVSLNVPDCEETPVFKRELRQVFTMYSGHLGRNRLFARIRVRWWRDPDYSL